MHQFMICDIAECALHQHIPCHGDKGVYSPFPSLLPTRQPELTCHRDNLYCQHHVLCLNLVNWKEPELTCHLDNLYWQHHVLCLTRHTNLATWEISGLFYKLQTNAALPRLCQPCASILLYVLCPAHHNLTQYQFSHCILLFSSLQLKPRDRPPWSQRYLPTAEATSPHRFQLTIRQSRTSPRSSRRAPKLVLPWLKSTASTPGTTLLPRSQTKASGSPPFSYPSWAWMILVGLRWIYLQPRFLTWRPKDVQY